MYSWNRTERRRRGIAALAFVLLSAALPAHAGFLSGTVVVPADVSGDNLQFCGRDGKKIATARIDGSRRYRVFLPAGSYRVELLRGTTVTATGSVSAEERSIVGDIRLDPAAAGANPLCR